ncbi:hypothetical protein BYT27DRAFT_7105729 [Phlegmacium glaucopus]|nr:hypothetical protein BYT27DRAFT_7105729 [Phlegmacium glaucopus]
MKPRRALDRIVLGSSSDLGTVASVPALPTLDSRDPVDFIIEFEVLLEHKPVLFVEIKEPRKIALKSAREEADKQM